MKLLATNQAANFTMFQLIKSKLMDIQKTESLPSYQVAGAGLIGGACGPLFNAPIDTIKTRVQKNPSTEKGWTRFVNVTKGIYVNEVRKHFFCYLFSVSFFI
jgi:solute carrier family 25 citrate transporter 1